MLNKNHSIITIISTATMMVGLSLNTCANSDPFITKWVNTTNYDLTITKGEAFDGQKLNPPIGTVLHPGDAFDYALFDWVTVDINSSSGAYKGTASIAVAGSGDGQYLLDSNNLLTFTYDASESTYTSDDPWDQIHGEDITADITPKIISDDGWDNGLGNSESALVAGNDYWGLDYGDDKWSIKDGAAYLTTKTGQYNDVGSRAFPFLLNTASPDYDISAADDHGAAMDGVWQIDMKIGSNGGGDFCETFYLAERKNMEPGVNNYLDGSGSAPGGIGREIDIMETKWQSTGPQINLPNGGGTSWNPNSEYINYLAGQWVDDGGAPATDFTTFGAYINDGNLWIYAYKTDGTQWYCTDAIPLDSDYDQTGDFVPYIGTWGKAGSSDVFETGYNHYVYLPTTDSRIAGKNPKDNPEAFGPTLYLNKSTS